MNKILFIDDEIHAIESFRIWFEPKFEMLVAENSEKGINLIKQHVGKISVAIVDMLLEEGDSVLIPESGLKLIRSIKEIDNKIQIIVFTGYPDNPLLKNCIESGAYIYVIKGLSYTRELLVAFVEQADKQFQKNVDHNKLSSSYKILSDEYKSLSKSITNEIKVGRWFGKENVSIQIKKIDKVATNITLEDDWKTLYQVSIGETIEISETIEIEQTNLIEQQISLSQKERLSGEIGTVILNKLKAELSSQLTTKEKISNSNKVKSTMAIKRTLSLLEPADYDSKHVVKRSYQYCGTYDKYTAHIGLLCSACKIERETKINLYAPRNEIATRLINQYNDGNIEIA